MPRCLAALNERQVVHTGTIWRGYFAVMQGGGLAEFTVSTAGLLATVRILLGLPRGKIAALPDGFPPRLILDIPLYGTAKAILKGA